MQRLQLDLDLELRETVDTDGVAAIIEGRAVPYGVETRIGDIGEQFAPGAFEISDVVGKPIAWRHDEPIGVITHAENRDDGLYVVAEIADTSLGRDAATLARRKSVRGLSVGFVPVESAWNRARTFVEHTRARLAEISMTHMPAYQDAAIGAVREEEPMTEQVETPTTAEVVDTEARETVGRIQAELAELREIAAKVHTAEPVHPLAQFRSLGEFQKAALAGEVEARALVDQVTDNNPGVLPPNWVMDVKGILASRRPAIDALGVESAGASGMDFNWPYVDDTLDFDSIVAKQANVSEGSNEKQPINSVQIDILKGTASLDTYAAGSDISYQLINRSDPSYVDAHGRIMAASYASVTDLAFVTALENGYGQTTNYDFSSDTDGLAFRSAVFAASVLVEQYTGAPADAVLVASDVFTKIGEWESFVPAPYGTNNVSGTATASSLAVSVSGLPVIHDRHMSSGMILVASRAAAKWIEDGPRVLAADDVELIGRNVAIWGMGTSAIYWPNGLVSLEVVAP